MSTGLMPAAANGWPDLNLDAATLDVDAAVAIREGGGRGGLC
jgi:hypothetical protein